MVCLDSSTDYLAMRELAFEWADSYDCKVWHWESDHCGANRWFLGQCPLEEDLGADDPCEPRRCMADRVRLTMTVG